MLTVYWKKHSCTLQSKMWYDGLQKSGISKYDIRSDQIGSVAESCPTLCDIEKINKARFV